MKPDTRRALDFIAGAIHELCSEATAARKAAARMLELLEANQELLQKVDGTLAEHTALLGEIINEQVKAGQRCSDRECKCRERFERLEQLASGS